MTSESRALKLENQTDIKEDNSLRNFCIIFLFMVTLPFWLFPLGMFADNTFWTTLSDIRNHISTAPTGQIVAQVIYNLIFWGIAYVTWIGASFFFSILSINSYYAKGGELF